MAAGDKSFEELNLPELRAVAQQFAVDLDGKTRKSEIIKEIKEMGVTWEMYSATLEEPEPEEEEFIEPLPLDVEPLAPVLPPEPVPTEEDEAAPVVLKMTRTNFSYEVRGYRFSRQHPYALVSEEDADFLIENGGFRPASPKELREFYGL